MRAHPTAFVTGAAGDIGRAACIVLAERGWAIAATDHPAAGDRLGETIDVCAAAGAAVWSAACDVTDVGAVDDVVRRCGVEFRTPVALFNNAGIQGSFNRVDRYPMDEARAIIESFGIRVNAVSPAFIGPGRMWDNQVAQQAAAGSQYYATDPAVVADQMIGAIPVRRFGSVDEVARVVAFLFSDDSSYVTGTNTEISGGAA